MGSLVQIQSPRPFFSSFIAAPRPAGAPAPRRPAARTTAMSIVVVTNDDGVHAPGLAALERALTELGEVYVLAPEREQSACGHALTLHRPLRPHQLGERRFAVNGTPSDCVNLAVLGFLPAPPVQEAQDGEIHAVGWRAVDRVNLAVLGFLPARF